MGWWATGNGDDAIGDGPADKMTDALVGIVSSHADRRRPVLTLQELLDAILTALRWNPEAIVAEGDAVALKGVVAEIEGDAARVRSSRNPAADASLVQSFYAAFEKIAAEYQDAGLNRKPRINELLATLDFVLGSRSESYASITEQIPLKRIYAEF